MTAYPTDDIYFADGMNAFNSASRTQSLLHLQQNFPEAYAY